MHNLVPCSECQRHVRLDDGVCPFCAEPLVDARPSPDTTRRLGRAAAFVFGATVAMGCGGETVVTDDGGAGGAGGSSSATNGTTSAATGGGMGGAGGMSSGGGIAPAYGAPATGGNGQGGSGGFMADYGAPPPRE